MRDQTRMKIDVRDSGLVLDKRTATENRFGGRR